MFLKVIIHTHNFAFKTDMHAAITQTQLYWKATPVEGELTKPCLAQDDISQRVLPGGTNLT